MLIKYPNQISHNLRQRIHKIKFKKKKNYEACTHKAFSIPGKRTNRFVARTKHAISGKQEKNSLVKYIYIYIYIFFFFKSMLVTGGFWEQIGVAWCFVDQNSTFKMYFSDQIRQIKKKKLQRKAR